MILERYPSYNVSPRGVVTSTRNTGSPVKIGSSASGYEIVQLVNDRGDRLVEATHRLVAQCFLENPLNLPQVNHIDGNKENNIVTNLEWISARGNAIHAAETGLYEKDYAKFKTPFGLIKGNPVERITKLGSTRYKNSAEAGRLTGIDPSSIKSVCKGYRASAGGFKWVYSDIPNLPASQEKLRAYRKVYHLIMSENTDIEHLIAYIRKIKGEKDGLCTMV